MYNLTHGIVGAAIGKGTQGIFQKLFKKRWISIPLALSVATAAAFLSHGILDKSVIYHPDAFTDFSTAWPITLSNFIAGGFLVHDAVKGKDSKVEKLMRLMPAVAAMAPDIERILKGETYLNRSAFPWAPDIHSWLGKATPFRWNWHGLYGTPYGNRWGGFIEAGLVGACLGYIYRDEIIEIAHRITHRGGGFLAKRYEKNGDYISSAKLLEKLGMPAKGGDESLKRAIRAYKKEMEINIDYCNKEKEQHGGKFSSSGEKDDFLNELGWWGANHMDAYRPALDLCGKVGDKELTSEINKTHQKMIECYGGEKAFLDAVNHVNASLEEKKVAKGASPPAPSHVGMEDTSLPAEGPVMSTDATGLAAEGSRLSAERAFSKAVLGFMDTVREASRSRSPATLHLTASVNAGHADRLSLAKFLVGELPKAGDATYRLDLIGRLKSLAESPPYYEGVQQIVVEGVIQEMRSGMPVSYVRHVLSALEAIALCSSDALRARIVRGIMDAVPPAGAEWPSSQATDAVTRIRAISRVAPEESGRAASGS